MSPDLHTNSPGHILTTLHIIIYCKRVFRTALGVQILLQHLCDVLHLIEMNNENHK